MPLSPDRGGVILLSRRLPEFPKSLHGAVEKVLSSGGGYDGFVGTGLRACPALRDCPSSGQARRPVPTANNSMIGIPSLPREGFFNNPPGGGCSFEKAFFNNPVRAAHKMKNRLRPVDKGGCGLVVVIPSDQEVFRLIKTVIIPVRFSSSLGMACVPREAVSCSGR